MCDHKNLETKGYAGNLMPYLDNSRSSKNVTLVDLNKILNRLAPAIVLDADFSEDDVALGEHASVYWYKEKIEWYLGVVAGILNDK